MKSQPVDGAAVEPMDAELAALQARRAAALAPLVEAVRAELMAPDMQAGLDRLQAAAAALPAGAEKQALDTLMQMVGHARNVLQRAAERGAKP